MFWRHPAGACVALGAACRHLDTTVHHHAPPSYASLLALVFAGVGAYAGAFTRRLWVRSIGSAA